MLFFVAAGVWHAALSKESTALSVTFLDVGQGDAVFIEAPSGRQMLIDGGRDTAVLRELGAVMPWYDRSIDVVVATHFDADHSGGLVPVLERFAVTHVFVPDRDVHEGTAAAFFRAAEGVVLHEARRGMRITLGDDTYVQVLFPDRDATTWEENTRSIVAQVVYGQHVFLLTGDAPSAIEEYLVALDGAQLQSDVLKVGHHGSRTSSSPLFVGYTVPAYAVMSRGCDNPYGHPHARVRATLEQFTVRTFDTCTDGRVTFESDGTILRVHH